MPDFRLSEGAQTNPASLPLSGNELVFFSQEINGVWTTVVAKAKDIADLGMTQAQVDALVTMIGQRAPAVHQHSASDINTGVFAAERIPSLPISKITNLTTQLGEKAAAVHTHQIVEIVGLRQELDALWGGGGGGGGGGGITLPIQITDVTGLRFELDDLGLAVGNKADRVHPHDAGDIITGTLNKARLPELLIADVTGLQSALDSASGSGAVIDDTSAPAANLVYSSLKTSNLLAGKRDLALNIQTVVSAPNIVPTYANDVVEVTTLGEAASIADPTGTPGNGRMMLIRIKGDGTARALTWGAAYVNTGASLPAATVPGKWLVVLCVRNNVAGQMQVVHAGVEGDAGGGGSGGTLLPPVVVNSAITLGTGHLNRIVEHNDSNPRTYTLAPSLGTHGDLISFVNNSAQALTITRGSGVTLYRYGTNQNIAIPARRSMTIYRSATANVWYAM